MNYKISIIVPVYNVEKYLNKCVNSILNQTYKNIEVILVDDGSPDNCGKICNDYAEKDNRVKVIHKKNGGLSDARNVGIKIANGDYLGFVDSDDWIEPQMYQRLIENAVKYNADISVGGVVDLIEENGKFEQVKTTLDGKVVNYVLSKKEAMKKYFLGSWAAWDKLYKRSIFDNIEYPVGIINEDEAIVLKQLDRCSRVCYTNEVFYNYVHRAGVSSITQENFSKKKLVVVDICKKNLDFIKKYYPDLVEYAEYKYFLRLMWCLNHMAVSKQDFRDDIQRLRIALKKDIRKLYSNGYTAKKEKFRGFLMAYCYSALAKAAQILKKEYT